MGTQGSPGIGANAWLTELEAEFNEAYAVDVVLPAEVRSRICQAAQMALQQTATPHSSEAQLRRTFRTYAEGYLRLIFMTITNNLSSAPRPPGRAEQGEDTRPSETALKRGLDTLLFVEESASVPFHVVKAEVLDYLGVPHSIPRSRVRFPWKRLAPQWRQKTPYLSASPDALKKRWKRARSNKHVYEAYLRRRTKDVRRMSEAVEKSAPFLLGMAVLEALLARIPDWPEQIGKRFGRGRLLSLVLAVACGKAFVAGNPEVAMRADYISAIRKMESLSQTEVMGMWRKVLRGLDAAPVDSP